MAAGSTTDGAGSGAAAAGAWLAYAQRAAAADDAGMLPTPDEAGALWAAGLTEVLVAYVYERVEATLRQLHVESFWRRLEQRLPGEGREDRLLAALQGLTSAVAAQQAQLAGLAQQLLGAAGAVPPTAAGSEPLDGGFDCSAGFGGGGFGDGGFGSGGFGGGGFGGGSGGLGDRPGAASALAPLLVGLLPRYRTLVGATLQSTAPFSVTALLRRYYSSKLAELCAAMEGAEAAAGAEGAGGGAGGADAPGAGGGGKAAAGDEAGDESEGSESSDASMASVGSGGGGGGGRDADGPGGGGGGGAADLLGATGPGAPSPALAAVGAAWCWRLRCVSSCLVALGMEAASEEAYAWAINRHVQRELGAMASKVFDRRVLPAAQRAACHVPLEFLRILLATGGGPGGGGGGGGGGEGAGAGGEGAWAPGPGGWGAAEADEDEAALRLQEWRLRLTYLLLETLGALRTGDMFDAVVDYPDSAPAIADLAECLRHTNLATAFAQRFGAALQARLLHAGAATADIITTYVSTIRALHTIDPSGALLEAVGEPVRAYLRRRPDTIRAIVALITDDAADGGGDGGGGGGGMGSLLEELAAGGGGGGGPGGGGGAIGGGGGGWVAEGEGDEAAIRLLRDLEQGARGALAPGGGGGGGGSSQPDVVSLLIGIYGGTHLFLEEYRSMLAARLLSKGGFDCEREVRTLEMLKIRFGDAQLHHCEVMLRDLADSKRLDAAVRGIGPPRAAPATPLLARAPAPRAGGGEPAAPASPASPVSAAAASPAAPATPVAAAAGAPAGGAALPEGTGAALARLRATICSHLFWPRLEERDLALPPELTAAMEVYAERYHHLKAPRKLQWRPSLGAVTLEVSAGGGPPAEFRVTPLHAALLLRFSGRPAGEVQTAPQLAAALGVPQAVVRAKALFWVDNGVLAEARAPGGDVAYRRADAIDHSRIASTEATDLSWDDAAGAPGGPGGTADASLAEMAPFENFILGILTNFSSVALERLHNLLRVFVVGEPKYEGRSQEQLASYLNHLIAAGKVEVDGGGVYRRKKG